MQRVQEGPIQGGKRAAKVRGQERDDGCKEGRSLGSDGRMRRELALSLEEVDQASQHRGLSQVGVRARFCSRALEAVGLNNERENIQNICKPENTVVSEGPESPL